MAINRVAEHWTNLESEVATSSRAFIRSFTVEFDATDSFLNRPILAETANDGTTAIPAMGQAHPYSSYIYVIRKRVRPRNMYLYDVEVEYSSDSFNEQGEPQNPLLETPVVYFRSAVANEPIDQDIDGNPITNSAGQSPTSPITTDKYDRILHIEQNQSDYDESTAHDYVNSVNSSSFRGAASGEVLCVSFEGRRIVTAQQTYWRVTYEFRFRRIGWKLEFLDEGLAQKNSDGEYEIIKDANGDHVTHEVKLDGSGQPLAAGSDAAYWREYEIKKPKNFNSLPLRA